MRSITGISWLFAAIALPSAAYAQTADSVSRGAYVAIQADCAACHTNPAHKDMPFAGGYTIQSPLGGIVASNITPSKTQGIGDWSEAEFARAVREGVSKDGRNLYPAMPYVEYSQMSDDDVHALYDYLHGTVAPYDVPPTSKTELKFPFNLSIGMIGWNLLFRPSVHSVPYDQSKLSRGKYLTDVMGHCTTCHTPRGALMNSDNSQYLAGGALGSWYAPNITSDKAAGIGAWTENQIVDYLKNGRVQGLAQAAGPMAEAVEHSFSKMNDDDLHAIAAYLRTVPAASGGQGATPPAGSKEQDRHYDFDSAKSQAVLQAAMKTTPIGKDLLASRTEADVPKVLDGARLYVDACATCHQPNGGGTADGTYPSLYNNATIDTTIPNNLVMTILEGVDRNANGHHAFMPGFKRDFSDQQIASLATYVTKTYGSGQMEVNAQTVGEIRRGGPLPAIVRYVNVALFAAGLVVVIIVALLLLVVVRRGRSKKLAHSL